MADSEHLQFYGPAADPMAETEALIGGEQTYETFTDKIASIVFNQRRHPLAWFITFGIGFLFVNILMIALVWLLFKGTGIWGINIPAGWGFAIINFVWWIGIGHAGTLISAILLLLRQKWRNSINRFAEAMTLFAVMCAGLFPLIHTGRPWVAYWLMPFGPNILGMWPQFRSPLAWDVFAVSTYFTVSLLFWFIGLIPDFATLRDRSRVRWVQVVWGMLAMGWRGEARHWQRYEAAYLILAGLSTPLVLSVHSVISFDFSVGIVPGWHATIFPPYFVAGAVYAGFAMVLTLAIPLRAWYGLRHMITMKHLDWCAKIMLATGLVVFYGYMTEAFYAWFSGEPNEMFMMQNRAFGPYGGIYWALITCNGVIPQLLWSPWIRRNITALFLISLVVGVGMWLERFVIVVTSLVRDFLPTSQHMYYGTFWDWATYLGTIGFFTFMMFLFVRYVPMINIFEMKELWHRLRHGPGHGTETIGGDAAHGTPQPLPAADD